MGHWAFWPFAPGPQFCTIGQFAAGQQFFFVMQAHPLMTSAEAAMPKTVTVLRSERVFMKLSIHHGRERASGISSYRSAPRPASFRKLIHARRKRTKNIRSKTTNGFQMEGRSPAAQW